MGGGYSYREFGKDYDNTLSSSDIVSLGLIKLKPKRITHIRIWVDEYITGFECYHDNTTVWESLDLQLSYRVF